MTADRRPAGVGQRAIAAVTGVLLVGGGSFTLASTVRALADIAAAPAAPLFSQRDTLYVAVWSVFSASLLAAGLSLLYAAWRARRHNMVPGPTLYVTGASLLVIALFVFAAGAPLLGALAVAAGGALMAAEYGSDHI
jgi:hypothetical protein